MARMNVCQWPATVEPARMVGGVVRTWNVLTEASLSMPLVVFMTLMKRYWPMAGTVPDLRYRLRRLVEPPHRDGRGYSVPGTHAIAREAIAQVTRNGPSAGGVAEGPCSSLCGPSRRLSGDVNRWEARAGAHAPRPRPHEATRLAPPRNGTTHGPTRLHR